MQRHAAGELIDADARGAAIALGNFDGVHLGHQAVIASARAAAGAKNAPLGIAVFEPHPRRLFQPDAPPFRLQTNEQRARALAVLSAQHLYEIKFDRALSQLSDEEFARTVLVKRLSVAHVSVGADFRFGRGRMGDAKSLARLGTSLGFSVEVVSPVGDGAKISSSAIREAIATGALDRANALLGRPWAIEGVVQRGFQRGRGFGFATANVALGDYLRPRLGVYAVQVAIDGLLFDGVANVGVNPTVGTLPEPMLEAHVFDFDADLYGKIIEVELIAFLRDEAKFETAEILTRQIAEDASAARALLRGL
ncbi:MAG: bifunctional riboflavin kinase/FAD synthetase [Proteobacteria bacterium]|nr:bifunctional riboflavin kinase/FAD synthetase [Pseudomonadota bacterium]